MSQRKRNLHEITLVNSLLTVALHLISKLDKRYMTSEEHDDIFTGEHHIKMAQHDFEHLLNRPKQ